MVQSSVDMPAKDASLKRLDRQLGDALMTKLQQHAPWEQWSEKLAELKGPQAFYKRFAARGENPLRWSLLPPSEDACAERRDRAERLLDALASLKKRPSRGEPADWALLADEWRQSQASEHPPSVEFALEAVGWTLALPRLATRLPADAWWELFAFLIHLAADSLASLQAQSGDPAEILVGQTLAGELPLALGFCLPKLELTAELADAGRKAIAQSILELTDGEGILHANVRHVWRALFASWTRSVFFDGSTPGKRISKDARLQFEWLIRQSIRIRRGDRGLIFEPSKPPSADPLLSAATGLSGDELDAELLACVTGKIAPDASTFKLPNPGEHSEWGELAILRSDWQPRPTCLGLAFHQPQWDSQLSHRRDIIWSGLLSTSVSINDQPMEFKGDWEELCWLSDNDVDYIELETRLNKQWVLQRQILLARQDHFLFMADALVGRAAAELEYSLQLPLHPGIAARRETETNEVFWGGRDTGSWVFPLALPEWQHERATGSIHAGSFDGRTLRQSGRGKAMYVPLWIDLDRRRRKKSRTWRALTVAENRVICSPDQAVAFRVQIGKQQWVCYRALDKAANRTFFGHNLITEFILARVNSDGELENLVEVE